MRHKLPKNPLEIKCGILNLDSIDGPGTHWTCWFKKNNICYYFDSFGFVSPKEFDTYIKCDIYSSTYNIQKKNDIICGHLCLLILYDLLVRKRRFHETLLNYI